jgi:hypothetical protein
MVKRNNTDLINDIRSMALALVIGLIFSIINVLITIYLIILWSDLVFKGACTVNMLFYLDYGTLPYIHAFIVGLPLCIMAGMVTAMMASRYIRKAGDAIILGGITGITASVFPYGATWALMALFAEYWVDLPLYAAYILLILLGVAVYVPLAIAGAYYYSKVRSSANKREENVQGKRSWAAVIVSYLALPLAMALITALTIMVPLAVGLMSIRT